MKLPLDVTVIYQHLIINYQFQFKMFEINKKKLYEIKIGDNDIFPLCAYRSSIYI